jgi:hypothetical protein
MPTNDTFSPSICCPATPVHGRQIKPNQTKSNRATLKITLPASSFHPKLCQPCKHCVPPILRSITAGGVGRLPAGFGVLELTLRPRTRGRVAPAFQEAACCRVRRLRRSASVSADHSPLLGCAASRESLASGLCHTRAPSCFDAARSVPAPARSLEELPSMSRHRCPRRAHFMALRSRSSNLTSLDELSAAFDPAVG